MKINIYKPYLIPVLAVLLFIVLFFTKKTIAPVINNDQPVVNPAEGQPTSTDKDLPQTEPTKEPLTFKDLNQKANEYYVKKDYKNALVYFKKAEVLEKNYVLYRSIYATYLELKDYKNAEIYMQKAISSNPKSSSNWVEYAQFETNYMNASFDAVSKVYLDGLKATKDNINLITSYASYLSLNKKYGEAITYLEKAISIDPARKDIFEKEIQYLKTR
jgi:tetratricopeptide (TPR) repeat protein